MYRCVDHRSYPTRTRVRRDRLKIENYPRFFRVINYFRRFADIEDDVFILYLCRDNPPIFSITLKKFANHRGPKINTAAAPIFYSGREFFAPVF